MKKVAVYIGLALLATACKSSSQPTSAYPQGTRDQGSTNATPGQVRPDTIAWQTYTDEGVGFRLQYPSDWVTVSTSTPSVIMVSFSSCSAIRDEFCKPLSIAVEVQSESNPDSRSVAGLLNATGTPILIGGSTADEVRATSDITDIYFNRDGNSYHIEFNDRGAHRQGEFILAHVVSSFAFVPERSPPQLVPMEVSPDSAAHERDKQRVRDIRQLMKSLEGYSGDHGSRYPPSLLELVPRYIDSLPSAPEPADGACASNQNRYSYELRESGGSYVLSFCLGGVVPGIAAGPHTAFAGDVK